jgi:hypothetical protein
MLSPSSFTWEAFATLFTGLAAVIAAYAVARRQTKIIERQLVLQELSFRSDAFDRRASVYNAIRHYISEILHSGTFSRPGFHHYERYIEAVETVGFLFSQRLSLEIRALDEFVDEVLRHASYAEAPTNFDDSESWENAKAVRDRKVIELRRRFTGLPSLFEREMSLKVVREGLAEYVTSNRDNDKPDEIGVPNSSSPVLREIARRDRQ